MKIAQHGLNCHQLRLEQLEATLIYKSNEKARMSKLECQVCGSEVPLPMHCGTLMKASEAGGKIEFLYCDACGFEVEPPKHHEKAVIFRQ